LNEGTKTGRREFADQVAKSRWLRIQSVSHVFALTLTFGLSRLGVDEYETYALKNGSVVSKGRQEYTYLVEEGGSGEQS